MPKFTNFSTLPIVFLYFEKYHVLLTVPICSKPYISKLAYSDHLVKTKPLKNTTLYMLKIKRVIYMFMGRCVAVCIDTTHAVVLFRPRPAPPALFCEYFKLGRRRLTGTRQLWVISGPPFCASTLYFDKIRSKNSKMTAVDPSNVIYFAFRACVLSHFSPF